MKDSSLGAEQLDRLQRKVFDYFRFENNPPLGW